MIRRERVLVVVWAVTVLGGVAAVTLAIALEKRLEFIREIWGARLALASLSFGLILWVVVQVAVFFAHPPKMRFIRGVAYSITATMMILGGGGWVLIPFSHLELFQEHFSVAIEVGDVTIVACVALVVGIPSLVYLVRLFPREGGEEEREALKVY